MGTTFLLTKKLSESKRTPVGKMLNTNHDYDHDDDHDDHHHDHHDHNHFCLLNDKLTST